jgi:hypothetical protein
MVEPFRLRRDDAYLVVGPEDAELLALLLQQAGELGRPRRRPAEGDHLAQSRGVHPREKSLLAQGVQAPSGLVGEPPESEASGGALAQRGVAHERRPEHRLP